MIYGYYYLHSYNNKYATQLHYSRTQGRAQLLCELSRGTGRQEIAVSTQIMLQNVVDKMCLIIYFSLSLVLIVFLMVELFIEL